jgi:hypothetical protein
MATFTENQVRQFYVATATGSDVIAPVKVDSTHAATDLKAKSAGACQLVTNPAGDEMYLMYKGPSADGLQRSDLIKKCNIISVKGTAAADMKHVMKRIEVVLNSNVSATAVVGQDYVLNIEIQNYIACGDDSTLVKFGVAKATTTTASDLYKKLAINIAKNFDKKGLISVALKTSGAAVPVNAKTTFDSLSANTATGIILEEIEQPWRLGAARQEFVNFNAYPSTIYTGGADQVWGVVTDTTASNTNALPNSKKVADMEYFFHKERGDVYGMTGFPNNIDTTYQVNPSLEYGYTFIDIVYYFEGNSHNVGKSQKTLTIVVPGKASNPEELAQKLIGAAASGGDAATGLYAFLEGTGVNIELSKSWDAA